MALSEEQRARLRASARALQGDPTDPDAPPIYPGPVSLPSVTVGTPPGTPDPNAPTQPGTPPEPNEPPEPNKPNGGNKGRSVLRAAVRHLGRWDTTVGGSIPTPGGIGWLIVAILFLIFAIVPFNGYSRLQWMWYALTGAATLPGDGQYTTQQAQQAALQQGLNIGLGLPQGTAQAVGQGIGIGLSIPGLPGFTPVR